MNSKFLCCKMSIVSEFQRRLLRQFSEKYNWDIGNIGLEKLPATVTRRNKRSTLYSQSQSTHSPFTLENSEPNEYDTASVNLHCNKVDKLWEQNLHVEEIP